MAIPESASPTHAAALLGRSLSLTKWYVDVVAADGCGAIAYWAELAWHGVRGRAGSVVTFEPGEPTTESAILEPGGPPSWTGHSLNWVMPSLQLHASVLRRTAGAALRLLGDGTGTLDWNCVAPNAAACLTVGGRRFEGHGYVECLRTSIPPWRLPIDTVRWGRALFGGRSFVWIQWTGAEPRHVLLVDGRQAAGRIHPEGLELASGERVTLEAPHVIRHGGLSEVLRPVRALWPLLPRLLREAHEAKWLARAHLHSTDGHHEASWAIHELVTLRR